MATETFELPRGDTIEYVHHAPGNGGFTFVTFNALTQALGAWEPVVQRWHAAGHGSLRFNLRGQAGATPSAGVRLDAARLVDDSRQIVSHVRPVKPVLVGLSIGGLFAMRAVLEGADADALVLTNTLRRDGPRLQWINRAVLCAMELGGPALVRDLYAPLLMAESQLRQLEGDAFSQPYQAPAEDDAIVRLLRDCATASWDVPYESLDLPVLIVTGFRDRVFYDAGVVNELTLRLSRPHRVDMPDSGHLIPVEQPAAFADAVMDFASGL